MKQPVAPLVVNGWTILAHPQFLDQLEALASKVEALKSKDPTNYKQKNATKRLAAISRLAFEVIPQDPERDEYRQGDTLGDDKKHWMRAKFFQQYRLFFRYRKAEKLIVYAWVNDEKPCSAREFILHRLIDISAYPILDSDGLEARIEKVKQEIMAGIVGIEELVGAVETFDGSTDGFARLVSLVLKVQGLTLEELAHRLSKTLTPPKGIQLLPAAASMLEHRNGST